MKKKILAIFATALLLALCSIPCFAYPSQNLTFGGFYQNENVTPYVTQEFRETITPGTTPTLIRVDNLSQEMSGFVMKVDLPFMSGYTGEVNLFYIEWYSESYSYTDTVTTQAYSDSASVFFFVTPRRGVDSLFVTIRLTETYTFAPEDASIVCTLYPISLNTSEIEATAYNSGFQGGYNDGLANGQEVTEDLGTFMVDIFGALAEFFTPLLSIEIWGINLLSVVSLLVLVSIAMIVLSLKK